MGYKGDPCREGGLAHGAGTPIAYKIGDGGAYIMLTTHMLVSRLAVSKGLVACVTGVNPEKRARWRGLASGEIVIAFGATTDVIFKRKITIDDFSPLPWKFGDQLPKGVGVHIGGRGAIKYVWQGIHEDLQIAYYKLDPRKRLSKTILGLQERMQGR